MIPLGARAQGLDDARARADCAFLELEAAVGGVRDDAELARCRKRATRPKTPRGGAPSTQADAATPREPVARPEWIDHLPIEKGQRFGVGSGPDLRSAFADAAGLIAALDEVRVTAEVEHERSERVEGRGPGGSQETVRTRERSKSSTNSRAGAALSELRIVDQYRDPSTGQMWALVALDLADRAAREDALAASILGLLAREAKRLTRQLKDVGRLGDAELARAGDTLREVRALGRSTAGRRTRDRWRAQERSLRRTLSAVAGCVEVEVKGKPGAGPSKLTLRCGEALLGASLFHVEARGGIASFPPQLRTDASGRVTLPRAQIFSAGALLLSFRRDLESAGLVDLFAAPPTDPRAVLEIPGRSAPRIEVELSGLSGEEGQSLKSAVYRWAALRWGAERAGKGKAQLKALARVEFRPAVPMSGAVALAAVLRLEVLLRGRVVFSKEERVGALQPDEASAHKAAVQSVHTALESWR